MIAKLTGKLDSSGAGHAVIDVGGVGWLVEASARTLDALGPVGGDVTVHTEMLVGEDFLRLLGFARAEERDWFRLLTSVQGVGAKVALAILSALEIGDLQRALATGDSAMVARANGVGPKLAQRITHELKDKAGALGGIAGGSNPTLSATSGPLGDAVAALTGLGFKPGEASTAVAAASEELGAGASLDALVRTALKKAAK
ncbi:MULTISPECIES: Holliday junction branch migration protein RuvA [Sphingopyxis]|jgi:Holliday junction DNA helicase RuvA|uniref:Holliday junction branch migration protein RuvA n=1 Tax=Sphingopyxis TaxID=165697 RepID=UPI0008686DA8|nr:MULTISPECIES: Holliday junction branch migration protein RuvA [Sphingopyxis]APW72128.1 Holliday junction branch migration protein RuvA [Sphingopyxis granuli]AVA12882.1 Holliday junction branch migration protein RuvA [Sphingopyxis sp. MG]ODU25756.1 MAG: Holliday junction DNA helicase RuvA [Sphingopyxis sp. SCN 67-31]